MKNVIVSLCDLTGHMTAPWVAAGYHAVLVDPQHPDGVHTDGNVTRVGAIITGALDHLGSVLRSGRVAFVAGFPPCTDVAVSGSRWFEKKAAADKHFQAKAALVAEQCRMIGALSGAPWFFENPVSVFSSIFGTADHTFHPYEFTKLEASDNYTKQTCLWTGGGFVAPEVAIHDKVSEAIALVVSAFGRMVPKRKALEATQGNELVAEWYPDNRIHDCGPSEERANIRSATPRGFAQAVFLANAPHLKEAANDNKPATERAAA